MGALDFSVRNVGAVTVRCKDKGGVKISADFVVSRTAVVSKGIDDVREVKLSGGKRAVQVEVMDPGAGQAGADKKKRGRVTSLAQAKGKKRFPLGKKVSLPVSLFVKGVDKSQAARDVAYPILFYDGAGQVVCEALLQGTVIDFSAKLADGKKNKVRKKLLVLSTCSAVGKAQPDLAPGIRWSYPSRASRFRPANALSSTFEAGRAFTDPNAGEVPEMLLRLTYGGGQRLEAFRGLRLTAPRSLDRSGGPRRFNVRTPFIGAGGKKFSLFKKRITYTLLDQFGKKLAKSTFSGVQPTIKENIHRVLSSPIPRVQDFIDVNLNATREWKEIPKAKFTDKLEASQIPTRTIAVTRAGGVNVLTLDPRLLDKDAQGRPTGVLMELRGGATHTWSISVDSLDDADLRVDATANLFSVSVSSVKGEKVRFSSRYRVVLT